MAVLWFSFHTKVKKILFFYVRCDGKLEIVIEKSGAKTAEKKEGN